MSREDIDHMYESNEKLFEACKTAYIALLKTPHDMQRAKMQPTLAALRDAIAYQMQITPEECQDMFETQVAAP